MKKQSVAARRAIAYIKDCRQTHVNWSRWAKRHPRHPHLKVGGGKRHHDLWVRRYNLVLAVLRKVP